MVPYFFFVVIGLGYPSFWSSKACCWWLQQRQVIQLITLVILFIVVFLFLYPESDELFQIVYEEDVKHKSDVQMHLWTYRPRITIDHMIHAAQQDKSRPLLLRFLEMVMWIINIPFCVLSVDYTVLFDRNHSYVQFSFCQTLHIYNAVCMNYAITVLTEMLQKVWLWQPSFKKRLRKVLVIEFTFEQTDSHGTHPQKNKTL